MSVWVEALCGLSLAANFIFGSFIYYMMTGIDVRMQRRTLRLNKLLYAELQATTAELEQHRKTEA